MSSWLAPFRVKFRGVSAQSQKQLLSLFENLEQAMLANIGPQMRADGYALKVDRAMQHVLNAIEIDPASSLKKPRLSFRLEARELDFCHGENVYSTTPRLLLRVPAAREPGASGPIEVLPTCNLLSANAKRAPQTDKTALIIHNQEGDQEKLEDRPVVQVSCLAAGDYVIYGRIPLASRKDVYDIVADVMNPPETRNAFQYFDEAGTVEDLAEIIRRMQKIGFANMYDTHDGYRTKNVQPIAPIDGAALNTAQLSGFYEKPVDNVLNTAVFLPGPVSFIGRGRSQETLPENGYAVLERAVGQSEFEIRPQSPAFIHENYVYRSTRNSVDKTPAVKNTAVLMFVPDHPLRDFVREFTGFQMGLADYNRGIAPVPAASPRRKFG